MTLPFQEVFMATVVITGGSRGIGAEAVRHFAARGDRVYFLYEKAHEKAAAVAQQTGAIPLCCNVADGQAVKQAFSQMAVTLPLSANTSDTIP